MIRKLVRQSTQRNPFEIFFFVAAVFSGALTLVKQDPPTVINALFPDWAQLVWAFFFAAGGLLCLVGVYWPWRSGTGTFVEQVGLAFLGNGCLFYACAVVWYTAKAHLLLQGAVSASLTFAFGAACFWKYVQIERKVKAALKVADATEGDG